MPNRYGRDDDERNRGEFSAGPFGRRGFGGDYARDTHRGGFGDDYARDAGWSGGGRRDNYTRDNFWGGTGAPGDWTASGQSGRGSATVGYGPGQTRSTFGQDRYGGDAVPYGEIDPAGRSHRGRGPKNWRRPDDRIHDEVNHRLTDDHDVDATEIDVRVENGDVTLTGTVGSRREKRLAEDIALHCEGVHDVHNRLTVTDKEVELGKARE